MQGFLELRQSVNGKSSLLPVSEFSNSFKKQFQSNPESDWYRSLFVYNEDMENHFSKIKSVKGYNGPADAGYLFFDLDNKDLSVAKEDTQRLLRRLCTATGLSKKELIDHVGVFFSGNKGFHVYFYTNKRYTPSEMKDTCVAIAGDLPSFDSVVYNTTRIIRIENTKHPKSGLFKVKIEPKQLITSVDSIKGIAKSKVEVSNKCKAFDVSKLKIEKKEKPKTIIASGEIEGIRGIDNIDFTACPKDWPRCVYALTKGIMVPGIGDRHQIFLALTRFFMNQGFEAEVTHRMLKGVAELNNKLYPETDKYDKDRIWKECVNSVYESKTFFNRGGWGINPVKDEIFVKYCNAIDSTCKSGCIMHQGSDTKTLFTAEEMLNSYRTDFAKNYHKSIIPTGVKFIDECLEIRKRTTTLIVGSAGSGKTSISLKILENSNSLGIHSVFFSMDMDMFSVLEKLGEKHTPHKRLYFREAFRKMEEGEVLTDEENIMIEDVTAAIKKHYGNTVFDYSPTLSLDDMKERIMRIENEHGNKVGLVLVDYASRITSHVKGDYENQKFNALKSKQIAQETDAAWIYLCQTSRNSGDSHIPLRTKRAAKGAGDWEEAAQSVITVWRPFAGLHNVNYFDSKTDEEIEFLDSYMRVYVAKNRMGAEKELVVHWKPEEGKIEELTEDEQEYYDANTRPLEKLAIKYKMGEKQ